MERKRYRLTVKNTEIGYFEVPRDFKNHHDTLRCIQHNMPYADAIEADAIIMRKEAFSVRTLISMRIQSRAQVNGFLKKHDVKMLRFGWQAFDEMTKLIAHRQHRKLVSQGAKKRHDKTAAINRVKSAFYPALNTSALIVTHGNVSRPVVVIANKEYIDTKVVQVSHKVPNYRVEIHLPHGYFASMRHQDLIHDFVYLHNSTFYAMISPFVRVEGTDYQEAFGLALNHDAVPFPYTLRRAENGDVTVMERKYMGTGEWNTAKNEDKLGDMRSIYVLATETWSI